MKINVNKKAVEVMLDDKDIQDLLQGKAVSIPSVGPNDSRPFIVSRWKNTQLKVTSKDTDQRAIAMLTGETSYDKLARERPDLVAKNIPAPEVAPFSIRRQDDAATLNGQDGQEPQAGAGPSAPFPRESASRFRRTEVPQGGHQDEAVPDGSEAHRQAEHSPEE